MTRSGAVCILLLCMGYSEAYLSNENTKRHVSGYKSKIWPPPLRYTHGNEVFVSNGLNP